MRLVDERILKLVEDEGWSSPDLLAERLPMRITENQVAERCLLLAHAELLAPIFDETYELTGQGQRYLEGEYDAAWFELRGPAARVVYARA